MEKPAIDWSCIYAEYLGGSTIAELARRHGVSYSAVYRRAQRDAWAKERERVRGDMTDAVSDRLSGSAADAAERLRMAELKALESAYLIADKLGVKLQKQEDASTDDASILARLSGALRILNELFNPQEQKTIRFELGEGIRELGE